MLDIIAAMDGLPREIEEEIFKGLADDSTSIAQLQRVNKNFASDQFLWRLLLAKSCSGYKAPSDCSLEALKSFVRYLPREKFSPVFKARWFSGAVSGSSFAPLCSVLILHRPQGLNAFLCRKPCLPRSGIVRQAPIDLRSTQ